MIKPILLLCAFLAHLSLVSAFASFTADYAPSSPRMTKDTGAIYGSEESDEEHPRSVYYTQPYKMWHGEFPAYQVRIRTKGDQPSTNVYVYGDFLFPGINCTVPNYTTIARAGKYMAKSPVKDGDGSYTCALNNPSQGGKGYLFFPTLPQNTMTIILIRSNVSINCTFEGKYGDIVINSRSTQMPTGYGGTIKTYVINKFLGACLNCSNTTNGGPCNDNNPCTIDTCGDKEFGCSYSPRVCAQNQTCNSSLPNGCQCAPGTGYVQDNPNFPGCGYDSTYIYFTNNEFRCGWTTPQPIWWRVLTGSFVYSWMSFTVPNFPYGGQTNPPTRVPMSAVTTCFDQNTQISYNGVTGLTVATKPTGTKEKAERICTIKYFIYANCPANGWQVGNRYYLPGYFNAVANYGNLTVNGTSGLWVIADNAKRNVRNVPTNCGSSVDIQQTLVSSWTESGVEYSRWNINISTTTESLYDLELSVYPKHGDVVDFSGATKVADKEFRVHVDDKRFAQGVEVPPASEIQEVEYVVEGREPAHVSAARAVCTHTSNCAINLIYEHQRDSEDDGRYKRGYVILFTNEGKTDGATVSFEVTLGESSHRAWIDQHDAKYTTEKIDALTTRYTVDLAKLAPNGGQLPVEFFISAPLSAKDNFAEPSISAAVGQCYA